MTLDSLNGFTVTVALQSLLWKYTDLVSLNENKNKPKKHMATLNQRGENHKKHFIQNALYNHFKVANRQNGTKRGQVKININV